MEFSKCHAMLEQRRGEGEKPESEQASRLIRIPVDAHGECDGVLFVNVPIGRVVMSPDMRVLDQLPA